MEKDTNVNNDPNGQGQPNDQDNKGEGNANQNPENKGEEISIPKHRFDEVNTKYQELKAWKEEQEKKAKEAEEAELAKKGEFETLLKKEKEEKEKLLKDLATQKKIDAVKTEAIKKGAKNPDVVVRLIDLDSIELSENGSVNVEKVGEVLGKIAETETYLFGDSPKDIGGEGGAPDGGTNSVKRFKRSQLADSKFYKDNEADILLAMKTGNIIDDVS